MPNELLIPSNRPIIVDGSVFYDDKSRTNNIIRLKKRIVEEFQDLKGLNNVYYRAELYKTYEELQKRIAELVAQRQGIPMLIFLYK